MSDLGEEEDHTANDGVVVDELFNDGSTSGDDEASLETKKAVKEVAPPRNVGGTVWRDYSCFVSNVSNSCKNMEMAVEQLKTMMMGWKKCWEEDKKNSKKYHREQEQVEEEDDDNDNNTQTCHGSWWCTGLHCWSSLCCWNIVGPAFVAGTVCCLERR